MFTPGKKANGYRNWDKIKKKSTNQYWQVGKMGKEEMK